MIICPHKTTDSKILCISISSFAWLSIKFHSPTENVDTQAQGRGHIDL